MIRRQRIMLIRVLPVILAACLGAARDLAASDANEILALMEKNIIGENAPRDMAAKMVMSIAKGDLVKTREIQAWSRNIRGGEDQRVMKFLSPADVRGIGFLVLGDQQMYIYLPEFHRTRRIASSNKKDSFVGSDFSYADMSSGGFSSSYQPKLVGENDREWRLELQRKPGSEKPYQKVLLTILKSNRMPALMECFDNSGNLWKRSEQGAQQVGRYWLRNPIKMSDLKRGSATTLELKDIRVDQDLAADLFSERFLRRGGN